MVATTKLDPIQRVCARHHRACPKDCGCRVILMTPVSHMCSLGLSTAATWNAKGELCLAIVHYRNSLFARERSPIAPSKADTHKDLAEKMQMT